MQLQPGEKITLDDNKEYLVIGRADSYVLLATITKPLELQVVSETISGKSVQLARVKDKALIKTVTSKIAQNLARPIVTTD
ncbi:hypothetical protein FWF48_00245 [Candidatus Saccharibacteria bacterium]|nr:hypothetical protein [Candidatus Saccharibacteria bacterium]